MTPRLRAAGRASWIRLAWVTGVVLSLLSIVRLSVGQAGVLEETVPRPVTRINMIGEWTGLGADGNTLVTLQVGPPRKTLLAVTETKGTTVSTRIYPIKDLHVHDGQFWIEAPNENITFKGSASKPFGPAAWGTGTLVLNIGKPDQREVELYLFFDRDGPWIERILDLARRYGLLS